MENTIFIGNKSPMKYAISAKILSKKFDEIVFVARGKNTSLAIDASQIALRLFLDNWSIKDVKIDTAKHEDEDKKIKYTSSIAITMHKNER